MDANETPAKDYMAELQKPFPEDVVKWRIGRSGEKDGRVWARALCYIDARIVAQRLDEVFGIDGWENRYKRGPGGGTLCGITVYTPGPPDYGRRSVTKWDGAEAPETEPVKGVLSDSFKRAAVMLGIGRYLYEIPAQFVETSPTRFEGGIYGKVKDGPEFYWAPPGMSAPAAGEQTAAASARHAAEPAARVEGPGGATIWEAMQAMAQNKELILEKRMCIDEKEEQFLLERLEKFDTYGEKTFISPPQALWLERIWERVHLVMAAMGQQGMQGADRAAEEPQAPSVTPQEPAWVDDGPPPDEDDLPF